MPDTAEHLRPTPGDGRRLTYAQLAERLAISGDAARILVRRRGWQRIPPNQPRGVTVVIVPDEALQDEDWRRVAPTVPDEPATTGDIGTGQVEPGATAAEQRATGAERRADEAHQRAEAANARADAALTLADRALAQLADAQARGDRAEARADRLHRDLSAALIAADVARAEARAALQGADELRQAEAARQARGLVARLRAAWRRRG